MTTFDFAPLLAPGLPPPASRWTGFPPYNFAGGHNDPDLVPVERLIAAVNAVLAREGATLASYGLESGPLGYLPLREFLAAKLRRTAAPTAPVTEGWLVCGRRAGKSFILALTAVLLGLFPQLRQLLSAR